MSAAPFLPESDAPTRAHFGVIYFGIALAVIQYIDRVCISQAAPLITCEFHLSTVQMGYVFAAFTLAYALFEIPARLARRQASGRARC